MSDYPRPSLLELDARIRADLDAMPGVLRQPLAHTWARACHGLHGHLEWIDRQCNPLTCELERLHDWAALYGVERLPASHATGTAEATGAPGSVILADTLLRGPNGIDYRVRAANFTANSGGAQVALRAEDAGESGNLPPGARLTLIDPLPGIDSTLIVADDGITGGAAEETVDAWRLRVAEEWQAMTVRGARGGRAEDYRYWCMSAHPAVTGALVQPHLLGLGTVVVRPICDAAVNRLPPPGVMDAIADYLTAIAPATADWRLTEPLIRPVSITLRLDAAINTAHNRERIAAAILATILAEKTESAMLYMAEVDSAIATVTNLYTRIAPTADIPAQPGEVLVLSDILWQ